MAVVVAIVFVRVLARNADDLTEVSLDVAVGWLALAAPVTLAAGALLPAAWREATAAFGTRLPVGAAIESWCLSQPARFLPTGLFAVASRAVLAERHGAAKRTVVVTATLEIGLIVAWACVVAAAVPTTGLPGTGRAALGAAGAVGLVVAVVGVPAGMARVPLRWRPPAVARPGELAVAVGLYGVNALVKSLVTAFLAAGLLGAGAADAAGIAGAVNVALVVGTLGVTPAGLGVREGAIVGLLASEVGAGNAAAFAVAARCWDLAGELVWLGAVVALRRRRGGVTGAGPAPRRSGGG